MDGIYQFGIAFTQWLQGISPSLDGFMQGVTFLGTIEFYILLIPALFWSIDQSLGLRVLFILILTDIPASYLKQLLHEPRPYWIGDVKAMGDEWSYGIPSSHASNTLTVWSLIALQMKKRWMWVITVLFLLLIGLTRPYLGMHFPQDVLGGWLLGLLILFLFLKYERPFLEWWAGKSLGTQIGLGFIFSMAIILIGILVVAAISGTRDAPQWAVFATEARDISHYLTLSGFFFGAVAGHSLMRQYAHFEMDGSALQKVGRYVLGMIGLFAIYLGLDLLFAAFAPDNSLAGYILRYVRYTLVSLWAIFAAPWVFIKLRLAEKA